ncbi:hypothetical protein AEYBE204_06730 [Asticcacaulis sp. YBE204]|nr:hypothetical protein AEYBE204_06730 [Asticcacaulis sp. YBE204]
MLDFYCAEVKLAVEVDGVHHTEDDRRVRDEMRDKWLAEQGIRALRIPAFEIMLDADEVATGAYAVALERVGKV